MDSQQKSLLSLSLSALGGVAGSVVGYQKSGAYWSWPRFTCGLLGSAAGYAVGNTIGAATPTTSAAVSGLGLAPTPATLLPAVAISDHPDTPLKLRRMEILRADIDLPDTTALKVVVMSTKLRAKTSNNFIPVVIGKIDKLYRKTILEAATLHNVPFEVIITKLTIENPDLKAKIITGNGATGLMQITPGTAGSLLRAEYKKGFLTEAEATWFRRKIGKRFDTILAGKNFTTADLQNPELNIHVGTLAIGQYLRKYTDPETGVVYLHKAVANYNRGDRAEYANARTMTPDQLIKYKGPGSYSTPAVTQQYIMAYCGPGGAMDLLTRNKLVAFQQTGSQIQRA